MRKKMVWLVVSCLMVLALLAASCAPKEEAPAVKEAAPAVKEAAPVVKETAPIVKEAAPVVKETAPAAGAEMVKISLTKLDGTKVEKLVEKPKYGGMFTMFIEQVFLGWDEAVQMPWFSNPGLTQANEKLGMTDWTRGPAGTGEVTMTYSDFFRPDFIAGFLAESWELPDDTTIVFHIRKGVKWALDPSSAASRLVGGRELTADDVAFTIKRIYIDTPTSTMYGMLGPARPTDVYATDKYTVVVKAPRGKIGETFNAMVGQTRIIPPEVVKKYGDMNQWENIVGTGPFMMTDCVAMSSTTWVRNPNYWGRDPLSPENQLPYVDGVRMLQIPDQSTRLAALRTHKVDMGNVNFTRDEALQLIKSNPEIKYNRYYGGSCTPMGYRIDKPELPFKDIRVRRALLMAINNQAICDTYYSGDAHVLSYKVPGIPEYVASGWHTPLEQLPPEIKEIYTYNPEKAKQLLTEAGYPTGFKTEVVVNANALDNIDILQMVREYWRKNLNVDLTLDVKEHAVHMSMYQKKTHKEMLIHGRGGMPTAMYTCLTGNMYNWGMVSDPKIDDYYYPEAAAAYFDTPKRNKLMREMNQYVLSQAWYYSKPSANVYRFWMPWVKNYSGEQVQGPYTAAGWTLYIWIDQELKKAMGR